MVLFFSAVRVVQFGRTLKVIEEGHAVLMRTALEQFEGTLPPGTDIPRMILGNQRADLPGKRTDGTISLWGIGLALLRAQLLPKFHHGMRQPWHHPVHTLPKVQHALYNRLMSSIREPDIGHASELFGGAMHTLQDTYCIGHTQRRDNGEVFSPLLRLHYSPSKIHPLISPHDRVWTDRTETTLTPSAKAAVTATITAIELWAACRQRSQDGIRHRVAGFVQRFLPIEGQIFSAA